MHGYIAGLNNTLLYYLHDNPMSLTQKIIDRIIKNSQAEIMAIQKRLSFD